MRISFSINAEAYRLSCRWQGFRTAQQVVIRHTELPDSTDGYRCRPSAAIEHYDRVRDPFQLRAIPEALPAGAIRRLDRVAGCSGIRGREEPVRGTPFCE